MEENTEYEQLVIEGFFDDDATNDERSEAPS